MAGPWLTRLICQNEGYRFFENLESFKRCVPQNAQKTGENSEKSEKTEKKGFLVILILLFLIFPLKVVPKSFFLTHIRRTHLQVLLGQSPQSWF